MTRPIVFIRGTGRCGSTTLMRQFEHHPQIDMLPIDEGIPEPIMDWAEWQWRKDNPNIGWDAIIAACRGFFQAYTEQYSNDAPLLAHKGTMRDDRLADLLEWWPEAKLIYLVRHPLGAVESLVNLRLTFGGETGHRANTVNSAMRWYNEIQTYLRSNLRTHSRVLEIKFEELLTDPRDMLKTIYKFLEVDDPQIDLLHGPDHHVERFVLNERERSWLLEETHDVVAELGYETDNWDAVIPPSHIQFLENHPERHMQEPPPTIDALKMVGLAFNRAAGLGYGKIGLFGFGHFTRIVGPRLKELLHQPVCLFDENPALRGAYFCGLPVYHPEEAMGRKIDAVIPASFLYPGTLVRRWEKIVPQVPILPLWENSTIAI